MFNWLKKKSMSMFMFSVNVHQRMTLAEEDLNNQVNGITHLGIQKPFSNQSHYHPMCSCEESGGDKNESNSLAQQNILPFTSR